MKKVFLFLLCVIALNCKKKEDPAPTPTPTPIDTTIRLNAEFTYQDSVRSPVPITFANTTKNMPTGWLGVNNKPLFTQNDLNQKITLSLYDYDGSNTTPRFMSNIQNISFKDTNFGFNIFYPASIKVTDNKDMLMQLDLEWLD